MITTLNLNILQFLVILALESLMNSKINVGCEGLNSLSIIIILYHYFHYCWNYHYLYIYFLFITGYFCIILNLLLLLLLLLFNIYFKFYGWRDNLRQFFADLNT